MPGILNMLNELAGRTFFSFASGAMVRPLLSLFFLMYTQSAFVISGRDILVLPQIEARSAESVLVAKSPTPFFFFFFFFLAFFFFFFFFFLAFFFFGFFAFF